MWTTDLRIRTGFDLGKALRNGDPALWFPSFTELDAWDAINKHVGRMFDERLSETTLRRLEIRIADQFDLRLCDLDRKPLSALAELCDGALGHQSGDAKRPRRKRGRPRRIDRVHTAKLTDAWLACGCKSKKDAARVLAQRFPGLTEKQLHRAIDLHRKNIPKPATE